MSFRRCLERFDSHERGILLQWMSGKSFVIGDELNTQLEKMLGEKVPSDAFVAMDFTLDWLYAAVRCWHDPTLWEGDWIPRPASHEIKASQEDIDLVAAWERAGVPHLLLIEAKGFTGWSNKQLSSKAMRLKALFDDPAFAGVRTSFVLVGPQKSANLKVDAWPSVMQRDGRFHFLQVGDPGPRWSIQRDAATRDWSKWRIKPRKW